MKFLLWVLIGFAVVMWIWQMKKPQSGMRSTTPNPDENRSTEAMVQCIQCGTYVPVSEAIISKADKAFCSEDHSNQHAAR